MVSPRINPRALRPLDNQTVIEIDLDLLVHGETVRGKLLEAFHSAAYRPPVLPAVALELLALSKNLDVPLRRVLSLLEKDSLIAGEVLKLAQSPIYHRGGGVRTLEQAVTRLGLRTLSDLCLHAALKARVFRAPGYEGAMDDLRRHSALTAQLCRHVSSYVSFPDDYAYTCGLMHDVGVAGCLAVLGDVGRDETRLPLDVVVPAIRDVHEEASATLARLWRLPDDVQLVLRHHHHPVVDGRVHPMVAAVALAEAVAAELGMGGMADKEVRTVETAAQLIALPSGALSKLRDAAAAMLRDLD